MRTFLIYLAFLLPALGQTTSPNFAGVITGTLTGEQGTSIAGGFVTLQLQPPYTKTRLFLAERDVQTSSDGSFRFERLNEGVYRLCAQVPQTAWLNPCQWGLQAPTVTLSTAQPSATVALGLKKGVVVPIRVDDPVQLLPQWEGKVPGAHLLIGVPNDALVFMPAPLVSQDTAGRNQQIVIPFNSAVKLTVFSTQFQLSSGALPLPKAGTIIPVTVPSGQTPSTIRLQVTGRSAP